MAGIFLRLLRLTYSPFSSNTELQILQSARPRESNGATAPSRRANALSGTRSNEPNNLLLIPGSDQNRNPTDRPTNPPTPATGSAEDLHYTYDTGSDNTDRARRELTPFQIFMIALNATLGAGLYWRAGQIPELGGAVAVLVSFILISLLVWAVMQCIGEMLSRWPIPGALSVFVSNFVDYELGIAVGIMYWLTYSVSFERNESFEVTIIYITIPFILIVLNCLPVKYYAWVEVVFGTLKISFLFIIIIAMIVLDWNTPNVWDTDASPTRGPAFLTAISTAVFAFVGVEIVAACALEAKPPVANATPSKKVDPRTKMSLKTRFSIIYFSLIIGAVYTVSGLMATLNVRHDACDLPRLSWLNQRERCGTSSSVFVLAAEYHNKKALASTFNLFLVFTALTCAQTNLYVASRALYGLATQLRRSEPKFLNIVSFFGETNGQGVPVRAVVLSSLAFIWTPFLQLQDYQGSQNSEYDTTDDASVGISSLSSVGVIIVWACECIAFLSYHITRYPYRSHFQPIIGGLAFVGCLFSLIGLGSAALYNGFHVVPFLSHFLALYRRRKFDRDYYFDVDLSASGFRDTLSRLSHLANQ
ncbi:amino acid permease/ SLC12A domain-containing protein [Nemania sp. FL0031]|nr:amino acid permease/ SLC12A domain-containing protein [Nemania sp. FL0031]